MATYSNKSNKSKNRRCVICNTIRKSREKVLSLKPITHTILNFKFKLALYILVSYIAIKHFKGGLIAVSRSSFTLHTLF